MKNLDRMKQKLEDAIQWGRDNSIKYGELIGLLEMVKYDICLECIEETSEEK